MQAPCNRAILDDSKVKTRIARRPGAFSRLGLVALACILCSFSGRAATITGLVQQIDVTLPNTFLTFSPTNVVLLSSPGLQIGSPQTVATTNGGFRINLDAGDYWVSMPRMPWRKAFEISVPTNAGPFSITNVLTTPQVYSYVGPINTSAILWEESGVSQGRILLEP